MVRGRVAEVDLELRLVFGGAGQPHDAQGPGRTAQLECHRAGLGGLDLDAVGSEEPLRSGRRVGDQGDGEGELRIVFVPDRRLPGVERVAEDGEGGSAGGTAHHQAPGPQRDRPSPNDRHVVVADPEGGPSRPLLATPSPHPAQRPPRPPMTGTLSLPIRRVARPARSSSRASPTPSSGTSASAGPRRNPGPIGRTVTARSGESGAVRSQLASSARSASTADRVWAPAAETGTTPPSSRVATAIRPIPPVPLTCPAPCPRRSACWSAGASRPPARSSARTPPRSGRWAPGCWSPTGARPPRC